MNQRLFGLIAGSACLLATCKKEDPPASYPVPIGTPVTTVVPASNTTSTGTPTATPVSGPPAVGMPCVSDQDLQCPFSHCVANRCGGCTSAAACKPGSQCMPTWLGYACFPGAGAAPATAPSPNVPVPVPPSPSSDPLEALRARCVQRTNELRATVTPGVLVRQAAHESCEDTEAQSDGSTGAAHGAFGHCQEAGQNECPGWPGPLDQVIDKCLAQMFAEGPGAFSSGHGHYSNIVDPTFRGVSCGFSTAANGKIWLVQDFYR